MKSFENFTLFLNTGMKGREFRVEVSRIVRSHDSSDCVLPPSKAEGEGREKERERDVVGGNDAEEGDDENSTIQSSSWIDLFVALSCRR